MNDELMSAIRRYDANPEKAFADTGAGEARGAYFAGPDGFLRPVKVIGMLLTGNLPGDGSTTSYEAMLREAGCVVLRTEQPLPMQALIAQGLLAHALRTGDDEALREAVCMTAVGGGDGGHNERVHAVARAGLRLAARFLA